MDYSCGSGKGKAVDIMGPKPIGAYAKAAHVEVVVNTPGAPTKVSIIVMEIGDHEAVEIGIGEIVVDPLLPCAVLDNDNRRRSLAAATASRKGSAPCGSRGTARGRPSLCTSVTVIGL
eukprot:scaffold12338_cov119-Isochrysis_galbana.AAC.6